MTDNNKYNHGKIYKLVNDNDDEIYIGSTTQTLTQRKAGHKRTAIDTPERRVYAHLNPLGWDNVHIVLIENWSCESIEQLKARERYWIDELKPSLNKQLPLRTPKEWIEANKEWVQQQRKQHTEQMKDKKIEYDKAYREKHNEKRRHQHKVYREENKENISKQRKEKIKCGCGCEVSRRNISTHQKSKIHQKLLSHPSTTK